ncbi:hypothetical protein [Patulibacter minatonensis]|uniref:hypothetical protein n=1 Tax=Patulibacter minatonensis TaxID=298163 RepID=UPI00047C576A|nr:hypothetical protein [Patulibacter minatonensis]
MSTSYPHHSTAPSSGTQLEPALRDALRHRSADVVGRLTVLTDMWVAGEAPEARDLRAVAAEIAAIRALVLPVLAEGGGPLAS